MKLPPPVAVGERTTVGPQLTLQLPEPSREQACLPLLAAEDGRQAGEVALLQCCEDGGAAHDAAGEEERGRAALSATPVTASEATTACGAGLAEPMLASLAARWSISRSSKFFFLPGTARRSDSEWVLQVRERVQGFPWSTIRTPQCLFGSYSRSLQGSSFRSRGSFLPEGAATGVAAGLEPAAAEAAPPPVPCFLAGARRVTGPAPAPGPGPDRRPEPPGVRGGGCWGEGSSFLSPPGELCLSSASCACLARGIRSTRTTGAIEWWFRLSLSRVDAELASRLVAGGLEEDMLEGGRLAGLRGAEDAEDEEDDEDDEDEEEEEEELLPDLPPPAGWSRDGSARSLRENALLPWRCSR